MMWTKTNVLLISLLLCLSVAAAPRNKKFRPRPYVWVLDAGHGGDDTGAKAGGKMEKNINLRVVKELRALLRKNKPGIKVILTREKDRYLSLQERCRIANQAKADLFVSVHCNYLIGKPAMHGTETFYGNPNAANSKAFRNKLVQKRDKSELVAWLMQQQYHHLGRVVDRGVKPSNYYVTLFTDMPSVLTELGFMSNSTELNYISSDRGIQQMAQALYNALAVYHTTLQTNSCRRSLAKLRAAKGKVALPSSTQKVPAESREVAEATPHTMPTPQPVVAQPQPTTQTLPAEETVAMDERPTVSPSQPVSTAETPAKTTTSAGPVKSTSSSTTQIPVYSIQILSVSTEPAPKDPRLKGLYPVTFVASGNTFKGLYGGTTDYNQARRTLESVRLKFPDAFIVAYLGDEPISTSDALKLTNK